MFPPITADWTEFPCYVCHKTTFDPESWTYRLVKGLSIYLCETCSLLSTKQLRANLPPTAGKFAIARHASEIANIPHSTAMIALDVMFFVIRRGMLDGERVIIKGLGVFYMERETRGIVGRRDRYKVVGRWKPSRNIKRRVHEGREW